MGFFSKLIRSWSKSSRLQELQKRIAPPSESSGDLVSNVVHNPIAWKNAQDGALEDYLDLCESDDGVRRVMQAEGLSRSDLKELYAQLLFAGLGRRIKGHYAALSTLAYVEPLQFAAHAPKLGTSWTEVVFTLLEYWEDRIPQGGLLSRLR